MTNELRVVIDTGVLISALLAEFSIPAAVVKRVLFQGTVLATTETMAELREVLQRKKFDPYVPLIDRMEFVERIAALVQVVSPSEKIRACRDPKDDCMLEAAIAGSPSCIVTGDSDLLALHPFRGVPILSPSQFLEQFDSAGS